MAETEKISFYSRSQTLSLLYSFVKFTGVGLGVWYLGHRKCNYLWIGLASSFYAVLKIRSDVNDRWNRRKKKQLNKLVEVTESIADIPLRDLPAWVSTFT